MWNTTVKFFLKHSEVNRTHVARQSYEQPIRNWRCPCDQINRVDSYLALLSCSSIAQLIAPCLQTVTSQVPRRYKSLVRIHCSNETRKWLQPIERGHGTWGSDTGGGSRNLWPPNSKLSRSFAQSPQTGTDRVCTNPQFLLRPVLLLIAEGLYQAVRWQEGPMHLRSLSVRATN
jgi:hypothetical protein